MFTKNQEEYLIRRLNRNDVILFLGAGFSYDAINQGGEQFPLGKQLSRKMWELMFPTSPFVDDGTSLQDMYQALLNSGISKQRIKDFLKANLTVKTYSDDYKYLTYPQWYKIYTLNIDNLIDKIYERWGQQRADNIIYPYGEFKERDPLLDTVQVVYLHGKYPADPDQIIFSRRQYAQSSIKLQPLYFHFINEYANHPTIFIGTALDEQLFDQYIATRQSIKNDVAENRPRSFLITPSISPIREKNLKDNYNIEVVKCTTNEFLKWIEKQSEKIFTKDEVISKTFATLEKLFDHPKFKQKYTRSIKEFSQSFHKVELNKTYPQKRKNYLLGSTPTWADINYELDAPRKITNDVFKSVEYLFSSGDSRIRCIAILGSAGSGKSTVLKRLCYNLVKAGRSVYHCHSENLPSVEDLVDALEMMNERVVLALDNAELVLKHLAKMAQQLDKIKFPPIFIMASRTNIFDRVSSKFAPIINLEEVPMRNLDREEVIDILKKLDENNLLGKLKGLTNENRIKELEYKAKKQVLVAMREATEGKDFDKIMKSEFHDIGSDEGKLLCLCVCLATDAGFTLSKADFTSFSSKPPSEALDILNRALNGLVLRIGIKEDKLLVRHRTIADYLIESCATPEMLKQAYIRVLTSLASEINAVTRGSRKFILYREIINHYMIYRRFSKDIGKAREVYESLIDYFGDDYQFWLQYGSLELEGFGGSIEIATNYLNQALSLRPTSTHVKSAIGQLNYKKALSAAGKPEAIRLKEEADAILIRLIKDKYNSDPYTYHIYGTGCYNWIVHWIEDKEAVKDALNDLQKIIKEACELYPNNQKLKDLKDVIFKAILLTAVNTEKVNFPIVFSNLET
jgi:DNA replication protein DnaC